MKKEYKVYWVVHNGNFLDNHPEYIQAVKVVIDQKFNLQRLSFDRGSVREDWPEGVSVYVSGTEPVDLLLCAPNLDIVSDRAKIILEEIAQTDLEFLPVQVFQENGHPYEAMKYWAIYVTTILDALAWEGTTWIFPSPPSKDDPMAFLNIIYPQFHEELVGNHHAFRFEVGGKVSSGWYVSREIKKRLKSSKCAIGMEFGPIITV